MYAFFNVIREQKELVTAQLFSHYEILHFCLAFTSLAFLVVCLCFVWFRWLGMKASGAVWLPVIYLCGCGAPVDMFDIYLCGCPLIYICLAVVPLLILSSSTVWISLALYPVGAPCVAVGAPVWLPSISSPHRE